ncbi:MAG: hypothetical protein ACP5RD_01605 [bacterium]|jgi:hypothetical protein
MDEVLISSNYADYNLIKGNNQNKANKEIKYEVRNFKKSKNNYIRRISISGILIYSFSKALGKYE